MRWRDQRARVVAEIVTAVCGLSLALTILMRWTSTGQGSTLPGYALAAQLRRLSSRQHPWAFAAAIGIYTVAAIGCVTLMTAMLRHRIATVLRALLCFVVASVMVILAVKGTVPFRSWGFGAAVTVGASLVILITAGLVPVSDVEEKR